MPILQTRRSQRRVACCLVAARGPDTGREIARTHARPLILSNTLVKSTRLMIIRDGRARREGRKPVSIVTLLFSVLVDSEHG